jgi:hypothetical protein
VLGFIWAGRPILRSLLTSKLAENPEAKPNDIYRSILRTAIWGLGVSWLIWYGTMSMYWIRYIFPAYFIGFIFVSAYISEHTNGFDIRALFQKTLALILKREYNRSNFQAAAVIIFFSIALGLAIGTMRIGFVPSKWNPEAAANYLRKNIPAGAKVETYESELLFLAPDLNYHFPPDLVSMQLYRRADFDNQYPINYDPLKAKPDYLVIGPFAQVYGLYNDKIVQAQFMLDADVGGYQIYHINNSK